MSLVDPAFVLAVAEGLGLKPSEDAAKSLAPDVEYRLREVVQASQVVCFSSAALDRSCCFGDSAAIPIPLQLTATIITSGCRQVCAPRPPHPHHLGRRQQRAADAQRRGGEPCFCGISCRNETAQRCTCSGTRVFSSVAHWPAPPALQPVYGFSDSRDPSRFVATAGHPDIYFAEDPAVSVASVIDQPLPPAPWEAGVVPHWLAVDGRQPAIPENAPLPAARSAKRPRTATAVPAVVAAATPPAAPAAAAAGGADGAAPAAAGDDGVLVRAPLRHVVSKELHLYFDKVAAALRGPPVQDGGADGQAHAAGASATAAAAQQPQLEREQRAVLASLRTNAGLQPLVPYLCQLVAEEVAAHLEDAPRLELLLR
jgi:hypothetical protein